MSPTPDFRRLCQILLNGPLDRRTLDEAEGFLRDSLADLPSLEGDSSKYPLSPGERPQRTSRAGLFPGTSKSRFLGRAGVREIDKGLSTTCNPRNTTHESETRNSRPFTTLFDQADESARGQLPSQWQPEPLPKPADPRQLGAVLTALAPTLLLEGVWLARIAQPINGHRPTENRLLALYCAIVGASDSAPSRPQRRRAWLESAGVALPPLASPSFFADSRIPDFALRLPCLHLALMHRPRRYLPEILGYTLAALGCESAWWNVVERESEPLRLLNQAMSDYPEQDAHACRIRAGWNLYRRETDAQIGTLACWSEATPTPEETVEAMIQSRRSHAIGFHQNVPLEGGTLDDWLRESTDQTAPLLQALRNSAYVNQTCPAGSRLIRAIDFGGPMFGVFDAAERQALVDWIGSPESAGTLREKRTDSPPAVEARTPYAESIEETSSQENAPSAAPKLCPKRTLFTALLHAQSPADCPPETGAAVRAMLRRTRWISGWRRVCPPARFSPDSFESWTEQLYRREVDRYRPPEGPPKISRELCCFAIMQLAPAILVDGSWLAGIGTAAENLGEIGRHLLRIYADELGDGEPARNHPYVYRQLLESQGFRLPACESEEFAANPDFVEAAFDIPVYLLAIGLLADRFLPELLGLNLAIELSGLGAGYRQAIDLLRHYGMDPSIVELHLSIDNLASGHAARARSAIRLHLDEIRRHQGPDAVQKDWVRIRTGYQSLNMASAGLAARLVARYGAERLGLKTR